MAVNEYHFITHWRVNASEKEVQDILGDARELTRWWPSVYLDVKILEPGDENGIGRYVSLYTKGWLPYTLRWNFRVTEAHAHGFTLVADGDFVGRGIWTFEADGDSTSVTYDWKIAAEKPMLKYFSFIFKPLFSMNHEWAMRQGLESLNLEIQRRHAKNASEKSAIPAPPAGTPAKPLQWFSFVLTNR